MADPPKRTAWSILENYFEQVVPLETYLLSIVNVASKLSWSLITDDDSDEYEQLIKTSYVGIEASDKIPPIAKMPVLTPMTDLGDVIAFAQHMSLKSTKGNMIKVGYRATVHGPARTHTNTIVDALMGPEWETLLYRVGVDNMVHLLIQTSIFIALPNECLCQMTGEPLIHIRLSNIPTVPKKAVPTAIKRRADEDINTGPTKRVKLLQADSLRRMDSNTPAKMQDIVKTPSDIMFTRSRLFYSRPSTIPKTQELLVGLPPKHILNKLIPCFPAGIESIVDYEPGRARHLSKYVFPRQYGLMSAFGYQAIFRSSTSLPSFADREHTIAMGPRKTPQRIKEVLPLLDRLVWRHGKCKYHILRNETCPSKIKNKSTIDKGVILEMLSGETSQLKTQASAGDISTDSHGNSIVAMGLTQAKDEAKYRPRIVDYACTHKAVYRYILLVTKTVIPRDFWGSSANFKLIKQHLEVFVRARRFESLSLHRILQGFSTADCEWLDPPGDGAKRMRVNVSDANKRRELLEDFLLWFFDSFVISTIKTAFYVTESAAYRNRVLYFRQDDWKFLCAPLIEKLTSVTFEKIAPDEAKEIISCRKLGFSFVRLLPKETGVRPIVNLRRKNQRNASGNFAFELSINQILSTAFEILTYERHANPHLLGMSVVGRNDVYTRLKQFKKTVMDQNHGKIPKLYFVKVDVKACFDTIEQSKLLEILQEVICHDRYATVRFGNISMANGYVSRKYMRKSLPDDDRPDFVTYATKMAAALHHTVFVDQAIYPVENRRDTIELLTRHIKDNIVKIGEDYYRQMVGIPQGSILSSILCAFFYGDMEKSFKRFTEGPRSVMLRLIDDYLFVTTEVDQARGFLEMMNAGHPEYGCFISKDKTMTNFDYDHQITNVVEDVHFPWCGYLIDMRDLSLRGDYSRYNGTHIRDTLTVARDRKPGLTFNNKMFLLAKARSHAIFSDSSLNSGHTVYLNIYQNFLLCAMKMHGYVCEWGPNPSRIEKLIYGTVKQTIAYCFASLRFMGQTKIARDNAYESILNKTDIFFLGWHAFHRVLSLKPRRYFALLKAIRQDLIKPENGRRVQRLGQVIEEGWRDLESLPF